MANDSAIVERYSSYIFLTDASGGRGLRPSKISSRIHRKLLEDYFTGIETPADIEAWARKFLAALLFPGPVFGLIWCDRSDPAKRVADHWLFLVTCSDLLFFYLQPACWETALALSQRLSRSFKQLADYSVGDYFVLACENSLNPARLLKCFDFRPSVSLHGFSRVVLQRKTTNQIISSLKLKSIKFTGYGLLKNTSSAVLEDALLNYGIASTELIQYKVLHQAFRDYVAERRQAKPADQPVKAQKINLDQPAKLTIAKRYNAQIQRLNLAAPPADEVSVTARLETAIKAVQGLYDKRTVSLDSLVQEPEAASAFTPEFLAAPVQSGLDQSGGDAAEEAKTLVLNAFNALDPTARSAMVLWLGLDINQADFLQVLEVEKQYQVARLFQRYQRQMLREIIQKAVQSDRNSLPPDVDGVELSKQKLGLIKDYLKIYSKHSLSKGLETVVLVQLQAAERQQLRRWMVELEEATALGGKAVGDLDLPPALLETEKKFSQWVEMSLDIKPQTLASAPLRIRDFAMAWLSSHLALL